MAFSNYGVASVFSSTDAGSSWTNVEGNLAGSSGPSIRCVAIVPFGGVTTYFAGTSTGLYSTVALNGASTVWEQEGPSVIGNVVVDMIDFRVSDGLVAVATHGQGIFSATLVPTAAGESPLPRATILFQNYPNPFNPSTTIGFRLARREHVTLTVFSMIGQEVARLLEGEVSEGEHLVHWRPAGLAAGMYFYTLRSADVSQTRSLLLLK
jgi:hypothetical protein